MTSKKIKILSIILIAVFIITIPVILFFLLIRQNLSSADINIPQKYIFLVVVLPFLFVVWLFLRKKTTFTARTSSRSTIPWYKDWWVVRIGYVFTFILFAAFGAYIVPKLKEMEMKWSDGKLGEAVSNKQETSVYIPDPMKLMPGKNKFMYAGGEYILTREDGTDYHFELANPGETVITMTNVEYPSYFIRERISYKNGKKYSKIVSGVKTVPPGNYIVTVNQNTLVSLKQYR